MVSKLINVAILQDEPKARTAVISDLVINYQINKNWDPYREDVLALPVVGINVK